MHLFALPRKLRFVAAALALLAIATAGAAATGAALVTHRTDWPLEREIANGSISLAARLGARGVTPPAGGDPRALNRAAVAYAGMCAACHGASGDGKGMFGPTTYPAAASLASGDSKERSDAELFWLIKNGISLTAMPGFAGQLEDRDLWGLVAYIRAFQQGNAPVWTAASPSERATPPGDAAARGAAVYAAQSCAACHGTRGDASGDLNLARGAREVDEAVREGRPGMPKYSVAQLPDQELQDMAQFLQSLANPSQSRGAQPGREQARPPENRSGR